MRVALRLMAFALGGYLAASPFLARLAYPEGVAHRTNVGFIFLVPALVCVMWTLRQLHPADDGIETESVFAPGALIIATSLLLGTTAMLQLLGLYSLLLAFPLSFVASSFFAIAWVQPDDDYLPATIIVGAMIPPFAVWLSLRVDERPIEGLVAASAITVLLATLWLLRHRSRRATHARPSRTS